MQNQSIIIIFKLFLLIHGLFHEGISYTIKEYWLRKWGVFDCDLSPVLPTILNFYKVISSSPDIIKKPMTF